MDSKEGRETQEQSSQEGQSQGPQEGKNMTTGFLNRVQPPSEANQGHAKPTQKPHVVTIDGTPNSTDHWPAIREEENGEGTSDNTSPFKKRMSVFSVGSRKESWISDMSLSELKDTLPHADHYRQSICHLYRPTLDQLRENSDSPTRPSPNLGDDLQDDKVAEDGPEKKKSKPPPKQGWIQGVLVRCLLNIFGVMLFLRLTWITGQAGIGLAAVIVLLASVVTTLTTMSMAAICTNGEVRAGGAYYMISRSLGPEFGGAIGLIFSLANAVAAAMYVVGFAETLRDLVQDQGAMITGHPLHDVRIIGVATSVLLLGVVMIGLDFESKAQLVLLFILIVSIINYFIGSFLPPEEERRRAGFVGYKGEVFEANVGPDFRTFEGVDYSFFTIFAIFFPAATGILAGANISGDLRNPSTAIPRGTFLAIFITTVVYLVILVSAGSCMLRDAIGTAASAALNVTLSLADIQDCSVNNQSTNNDTGCKFGLHNTRAMIGTASAFQPLIYAGIFSATLSSALASIVSAPKVFQALGKDKLFPFIGFFAKGYGKNGEPRRGYILTFVICVGMTAIGSLDVIAPIISNFFLMAYALINFSCFDAAMANSPGFRPSFRMFNKWFSLLGALLCAVIMFMISWWAALITLIVVTALYVYLKHTKPDVNWGSSGQARAYNDALRSTAKLVHVDEHVKNFRPQILALTGYPRNRPDLVDFAASIARKQNLLICGQVFQGDMLDHLARLRSTAAYRWFRNHKVNSFYASVAAPTVRHGVQTLLQSQGLGKLRPNTLLLGFKNNWQMVDPRKVHNYVGIIHDAFDLNYGVGVLRLPDGMDTHKVADSLLDSTDDTVCEMTKRSLGEDMSEAEVQFEMARKRRMSTVVIENPDVPFTPLPDSILKNFTQPSHQGVANPAYRSADDDEEEPSDYDEEDSEEETKPKKGSKGKESEKKQTKFNDQAKKGTTAGEESELTQEPEENESPRKLRSVLSKQESKVGFFRGKQSGTIDVWWLFDDGGLGLLLPHILSTRKKWKQCKLRVFCAGTKMTNLEQDQIRIEGLLKKFRIDYSDITVLPDLIKKPRRASYKEFEELIYRWRLCPGESPEDYPWKVSNEDLVSHKTKIYMQIKIREKLLEYSKEAALICLTLPVPRKFCPAGLYMAWLDTLTRDLPPTLLIRGNQQSVLTYFS